MSEKSDSDQSTATDTVPKPVKRKRDAPSAGRKGRPSVKISAKVTSNARRQKMIDALSSANDALKMTRNAQMSDQQKITFLKGKFPLDQEGTDLNHILFRQAGKGYSITRAIC